MLAFTLPFLGSAGALALGGLAFNLAVLPRIAGERLFRDGEPRGGLTSGIVLYPLAVTLLVVAYWQRLEVAAAIWGLLAFGDGAASLAGRTLGRWPLPWNRQKSWAGTLAYWLFGTAAVAGLLLWFAHHEGNELGVAFALSAAALTALFAAWLESRSQGLDDNLGVPLVASLVLLGLLQSRGYWEGLDPGPLLDSLAVGAFVNSALAMLAYLAGSLTASGAAAGFVAGTAVYTFLGWRGWLLLGAFFLLGTALSRLGRASKAAAGRAQERRSARHVLANGTVPALAAVFAAVTPHHGVYVLAFAGALAAAAADTAATELGVLSRRPPRLLTSGRRVDPGTPGAVSLTGTAAALAAAVVIAHLGHALGFYPLTAVAAVTLAAVAATLLESLAGATLERRGLLDHDAVNFLNTLVGGLLAVGVGAVVH